MKKLILSVFVFCIALTINAIESYDSNKIYSTKGSQVIYNGKVYQNEWWTKGDLPSGFDSNQWYVWRPVETPTPPPPVPPPVLLASVMQ